MSETPSLLFPSANAFKFKGGQKNSSRDERLTSISDSAHAGAHTVHSSRHAAAGADLDWLTNKSFRSDDAVTIARQHLRHGGHDRAASSRRERAKPGADEVDDIVDPTERAPRGRRHKREHDRSSREKRHHRRRHRSDKKQKTRSKETERRRSDSSVDSSPEEDNRRIPGGDSSKTISVYDGFHIDVKSDRNNLCFDSLHFTDTVAYRRLGYSCLGLDKSRQSVDWRDGKPKKKRKAESSNKTRYFVLGLHGQAQEEAGTSGMDQGALETTGQMTSSADGMSYIPVDTPGRRAAPSCDPLGVYDASTQAYLGSSGPPKAATSGVGSGGVPASGRTLLTRTTAAYNKHLHENPQDVDKWLEFVRFQDTAEHDRLVSAGGQQGADSERTSRKRTARAVAEKKLAVLDKALQKNPGSVGLELERLEVGKWLWAEAEQARCWERLLKAHPEDLALWRQYLLFRQSSFSAFTVSKVAELYGKCFGALLPRSQELEEAEAANLEDHLLDLFVSLCFFWRQAGHTEKAVAAFQAMVELNCFCPPQFQQDTRLQGQVAFLETFWDSSKPLFGEKGAKGWADWMQRKERGGWEPVPIPDAGEAVDEESSPVRDSSSLPLWQAWLREEVSREQDHFAPWRPDEAKGETEEDCEDPERMVLFDDISQALFRLQSPLKRFQLVLHFLSFLGVDVPQCLLLRSTGDVTTGTKHFLEQPSQVFSLGSSGAAYADARPPSSTPSGVIGNCGPLECLASSPDDPEKPEAVGGKRAVEGFVEQVFGQIAPVFPEPARTQLLLLRLDFQMRRALLKSSDKQERKKRLKESKRFAKRLLGQEENRNNLDLWASLARWERSLGNTDEAKRVLQTALAFLGPSETEMRQQSASRIAETFADLCIGFGSDCRNNMEVLHVLTSVAEGTHFVPLKEVPGQVVSSMRILKGRRNYQELMMQVLASRSERTEEQSSAPPDFANLCNPSGSHTVHLTKCFATFQYLTVGMQAASVVFESSLSSIRKDCAALAKSPDRRQLKLDQELLTVAQVRLLSAHVFSGPGPLGTLRNLVKASLGDFPGHPALLEAFVVSETRSHIAGRVRRYFDQLTRQAGSPTHWLFAVRAELLRREALAAVTNTTGAGPLLMEGQQQQVSETGVSHRIRSLFDRASESQSSRHCVLLWRMYIQFEMLQGNTKRAESIFYSALQHCPWAKVLYLDAVRYFPSKLQDIQDLLMEKELHVRAPLEEVELLMKP